MTESEEQKAKRKAQEAEKAAAWSVLALNPSFQLVWEKDLQPLFLHASGVFSAGDGFNPIPAAQRDGNRQVIAHISKRLGIALASLEDEQDQTRRPDEAK